MRMYYKIMQPSWIGCADVFIELGIVSAKIILDVLHRLTKDKVLNAIPYKDFLKELYLNIPNKKI